MSQQPPHSSVENENNDNKLNQMQIPSFEMSHTTNRSKLKQVTNYSQIRTKK